MASTCPIDTAVRPFEVLYIGGWGRSGSTLLDRLLGELDGFVPVGELRDIWQRGVVENRMCGCGVPFLDCPFWSKVGEKAFGGWLQADIRRMLALRRDIDRPWRLPLLLVPRLSGAFTRRAEEYARALSRIYRAIADVSGGMVIVDSSKIGTYALLLQRAGIPIRITHLVRDSRAVMFSWSKLLRRTDGESSDHMLRYGLVAGCARYLGYNGMTTLLSRSADYERVRYEDVVRDPLQWLRRIGGRFNLVPDNPTETRLRNRVVTLRESHTVDGNPMRHHTGNIQIVMDSSWQTQMPKWRQRMVTAFTLPLFLRYGYWRRQEGE